MIKNRVSIVMLSCQRPSLLQRTCTALFDHIDKIEPNIDIEYIIVDNASGPEVLTYVESLKRFDHIVANNINRGQGAARNQGIDLATGEFIFDIEDDWVCDCQLPFIQMSLDVLNEFDDIGISRLKRKRASVNVKEVRSTVGKIQFEVLIPSRKNPCAVFNLGCNIIKKVALACTGPIMQQSKDKLTERKYARKFENNYKGAKIQGIHNAFIHIGDGYKSPGWKTFRI